MDSGLLAIITFNAFFQVESEYGFRFALSVTVFALNKH
jgi:hypothetical protein